MDSQIWVEMYPVWDEIRKDVLKFEGRCFGARGFSDSQFREAFTKSQITYALRYGDKCIGYLIAVEGKWGDSLYVDFTAIDPDFQGRGLVAKLYEAFESELRLRGIRFYDRDSRIETGWADTIQRYYGDRVVAFYDHPSNLGPLRFMRIRVDARQPEPKPGEETENPVSVGHSANEAAGPNDPIQ